jgi:hypothetical protein
MTILSLFGYDMPIAYNRLTVLFTPSSGLQSVTFGHYDGNSPHDAAAAFFPHNIFEHLQTWQLRLMTSKSWLTK